METEVIDLLGFWTWEQTEDTCNTSAKMAGARIGLTIGLT